jgi:hypothetical protein
VEPHDEDHSKMEKASMALAPDICMLVLLLAITILDINYIFEMSFRQTVLQEKYLSFLEVTFFWIIKNMQL